MYLPYVKHVICSVSPCECHDCQPTNFWVVALRVSVACAKLSPHLSLRSFGVVLECRLDDNNVLGSPMSLRVSAC